MIIHITGAKCIGIDAIPVTIEIDINNGIGIHLVGLADAAVKESLLRTVTALHSKGFRVPGKRLSSTWRRPICTKKAATMTCPLP